MIRKIVVALIMILSMAPLCAVTAFDLRLAAEWSYDTNAFSDPLPKGYDVSVFPNGGEFLKRQNVGIFFSSDIYFSDEARVGLSASAALRFPYFSESVIPDGNGTDWGYRTENSTARQSISLFCGLGPVFRYGFGIVEILLPIRISLGSYDWFTSGIVFGVSLEPGVNIFLSNDLFLTVALTYDAHLMKFLFSLREIYDSGYIMLTTGAYLGIGFRFGGSDA